MRRAVVALVAGLLVVCGAAVGAIGAVSRATLRNRAEARADAKRQLASVSLPPGAREVAGDRSDHGTLGSCGLACNINYNAQIDDHRFWRVPDAPKSVVSWVRSHPPEGGHLRSSGRYLTAIGKPPDQYVLFDFPPDHGRVFGRSLEVDIASAQGGGSALRVDSAAIWLVTRPRWDTIPGSVRLVTARVYFGAAWSRPVTLTSTRQLALMEYLIDGARVRQPGPPAAVPGPVWGESAPSGISRPAGRTRAGARGGVLHLSAIHVADRWRTRWALILFAIQPVERVAEGRGRGPVRRKQARSEDERRHRAGRASARVAEGPR